MKRLLARAERKIPGELIPELLNVKGVAKVSICQRANSDTFRVTNLSTLHVTDFHSV
ncbi:MAG: hypothetical protein ABR962_03745 [Candidatus Bathyarchaeia archaeon]